jgi:hypothetical protein
MDSPKIAAAVLMMAFLGGCTMRTPAVVPTPGVDFSERDAYGQSFAVSPTYAGQDTSWTTTAPARAALGSREDKAAATDGAAAKAKGADEGSAGKIDVGAPVTAPAKTPPRPSAPPAQGGQSPAEPATGASGR